MESTLFDMPSTSTLPPPSSRLPVSTWNNTAPLKNIPLDSNLAWLLCALVMAMSWVIYVTYYNSRVIGFIITKILNHFIKKGFIKVGSLSVSVLSGKIMFRDIAYITEDYTCRAQDGWIIFRWWYPYVRKEISEDLSHSDARLSLLLNGFELHVYNRTQFYSRLEHLFSLETSLSPSGSEPYWQDSGGDGDGDTSVQNSPVERNENVITSKYEWRNLIPVIKAEISTGRLVFGNRLLPTTLSVNFEEAHILYTTKPASSRLDHFTHIAKCKAENFKVILAPSPKYTGLSDEPPRYMGEGFVVFQSNFVDLYYYQDEAGLVTAEPEMVELADGDIIQRSTAPLWGLDIKCGKGTDFSYGPWADRQREHLYKFFFPQDYQPLEMTKESTVGERRFCESFDIRLNTLAEATIDILFSKEKETNAVHMNVGQGSYLEVTIPMRINEDGYSSKINGQLLHLEASTSLQYRSLVDSETLEFDIWIKYPKIWNDHQMWNCSLTGCKATVHLIYAHKHFFHALMEDWASKSRPDILHFVPYTWHFGLILKEFELITTVNEFNWIDCSSQHQENNYLAVSGDQFELSFDLPFMEYLPPTVSLKFWIQGESCDMCMYLPEVNSNRDIILMLEKCAKLTGRDGSPTIQDNIPKRWRNMAKTSAGWVDCWSVPIVAFSIGYTYHPTPPCGSSCLDLNITTPEKEEILLSPIRPNGSQNRNKKICTNYSEFDPMSLAPDTVHLELEIGPSILKLYGSLLRNLLNLKENYFGENQKFFEFDSPIVTVNQIQPQSIERDVKEFDPRSFRPLEITVSVIMHDIQGHIMKCCNDNDPPCPSLYLERFAFEMHKTYEETVLQLLLSPLVLSTVDTVPRPECHSHLKDGHLVISSLQVRGHAMFSGLERPLESETLEYSWLVEVLIGDITGRLTIPQVYHTVTGLELFAFQVQQADCDLQPPHAFKLCQHDVPQFNCVHTTAALVCPSPDDIKYRMTRLSIDALDLCIVESGTAVEIEVFPLRLATCNLHGSDTISGLSMLLQHVQFKQYAKISSNLVCSSAYSIVSHGMATQQNSNSQIWLEVGGFSFGPVYLDAASAQMKKSDETQQEKFLKVHDGKRKKLWFLWPVDSLSISQTAIGKCGCVGGCSFFGNNRNGLYFFNVSSHLEDIGPVSARYQISTDNNLGYGESLLHKGHFVFDIPENLPVLGVGYSSSHSEKSFIATDSSHIHSRSKLNDTTFSKSSDTDSQFIPRGQSAFSESFLDDKLSTFNHTKIINDSNIEGILCDSSVPTFPRESRYHQVRCIKRQFSSPTHMSMPSSSSVLSSYQISMAQSAPVSSKHDRKLVMKSDDWKNTFDNTVNTVSSVKEESVSPGLSQNKYSSRVSLNTCPNVRGENSGSRHSLASIAARSYSPRSVRRAASTESTHSTESYFSADEDAESSADTGDITTSDETHVDEDRRHISLKNGNNSIDRKVSTARRSLHDIQETPSQQSSDSDLHATVLQRTPSCGNHHDPSDSNSISSTSFLSAMSSQEDIALVDLHNQMDKPIIESPLLMSCYMAHMTQLQCHQWFQQPPLPHFINQMDGHHNGPYKDFIFHRTHTAWKPKFVPLTEGFTSIHMVDKSRASSYRQKLRHTHKSMSTHSDEEFQPGSVHLDLKKDGCTTGDQTSKNASKIILVIKLSGDVHFKISPLLVESLRSFIDVLTPTLSQLHPLTIVNHLHVLCSHEVQQSNQLKKEKVLHLSQLRAQIIEKYKKRSINNSDKYPDGSSENLGNNYEETRTIHTRTLIKISKINISIMQASIVEEVIAFSALDNLKDLTCVSLLSICVDNTLIQLSHSCQAKKVIQTFADYCNGNVARTKINERSSKKAKTDSLPTELLSVETSETQQEETILSASIVCIHCQLRRLKNNSSILKEAMLTVIPYHRSKVEFTFENHCFGRQTSKPIDKQDVFMDSDWNQYLDEEKMGFIMFECGLEDIGVKFVKRWGYESIKSNEFDEQKHAVKSSSEVKAAKNKSAEHQSPSKHNNKSCKCDEKLDTKMSFPSCISECGSYSSSNDNKCNMNDQNLKGDASSFIVELKTVWFNFAAPPRTPNTRKIDFTRLDWHLLSTATPSINAWLKPSDRLLVSIRKMAKDSGQRSAAAMACLMAEALEVQSIHMPIKSKYHAFKLSPLAKTLQEDPSCQLLIVLRRYLKQVDLENIEENLAADYIPSTKTIHRGLIALSRQWKNVLYMPFLVEQNIRFRKNMRPLNLSFSAPKIDAMLSSNEDADKLSLDECEITDETTNLLIAEGGSLTLGQSQRVLPTQNTPPIKSYSSPETGSRSSSSQQEITEEAVSSGSGAQKTRRKLPSYPPRTSRASVAFPLLGGPLDSPGRYAGGMNGKSNGFNLQQYGLNAITKLRRNDSRHSLKSTTWSLSSIEPNLQSSVFGTPQKGFVNGDMDPDDEDLYNWMARQQDYIRNTNNQKRIEHAQFESKKSTFATDNSFEAEIPKSIAAAVNFAPLSIQLADAHVIFQPLLNSIGVPNHAHHTSFSVIFGPKISVSGTVEMLKIDIVESEYQSNVRQKKKSNRKQANMHGKFFIDTSMDTPTFICDKFSLEMEFRETLCQKGETVSNDFLISSPALMLMSNGSKHSIIINFTVDINFVAQQVNMPLLRLLHQFSTMYENIKETRLELKANRPSSFKESAKNEKKGFSPSESQTGSYRLNTSKPPSTKFNTSTPTPTKSVGVANITAGIRRPHTLSQRLRASTKGYTNLQDMTSKEDRSCSPLSFTLSESVAIDIPDTCSAPVSEHTLLGEIKRLHPRCWRTMFYLLDLYDTMPEPKTVNERCSAVHITSQDRKSVDVSEEYRGSGKYEPLKEQQADADVADNCPNVNAVKNDLSKDNLKGFTKALIVRDWTPLIIFGVATVHKTRLLAMLSGLKLEGELNGFHLSLTHKDRVHGTTKKWSESSLAGQLGQAMVVVLEGVPPNQQTVVKMTVGKSQALYSSQNKNGKDRNSALIIIGPINIDIPQHPVVLHGMMTRSSRQLSTTLQELRATRQPLRPSRQIDEYSVANHSPQPPWDTPQNRISEPGHDTINPFIIQFSIILDSLTIGAAVLPSLKAQYQMGQVISMGVTGSKAKFTVDLPQHTLSFNTKVQPSEGNMPSSASVDLPPVHISAEYIQDPASTNTTTNKLESFTDGVVLCQGSYLSALAEIGSFEHSLTTDLLNHLVLVQKVFMKEVNEVVQKMSGADKPISLWGDVEKSSHIRPRRLLFSLLLRLKGIQITATTPTSSAVRLETGVVELQLSNRVQNMSSSCPYTGSYMKLFGKAQVDVNLALGQLIKNALFEEAEPEFQQFAYFKTRICMRNALQDEMISSHSEDKEAVLITLNRPLIYIQPIALDKAVLVWLNYKNAYEYWNEQRASLNKEVLTATQQVFERVPQISQLSSQALGTLFLQLTVDDMGICLPLNPYAGNVSNKMYDTELKAAVVVTLESTRISACSCGSLVSKAKFTGLCIRFADDFEISLDDWKPDPTDSSIMNLCVVSEGTYEICSRTVAPQGINNAKWILNVQWQMEGVDIHLDTNIGKQLSALFKTLTAITGVEDESDGIDYVDNGTEETARHGPCVQEPVITRKGSTFVETLPPLFLDPSLDAKKRSRLIEKEMNEQAKIINDLRLLGASQSTIEQEVRRLHELETAVFNDFRRDVIKKLRRQSVKATSFKDKLGLGTRSTAGPLQSMSLFFPDAEERSQAGQGDPVQTPSSKESSPSHTHTRTGSLDMSDLPNLTLPDKTVHRELSLDSVFTSSAAADLGYSETPTPSHTVENSNTYTADHSPCPADHNTSSESPNSSSVEATVENGEKTDTTEAKKVNESHKTGHTTPGGASSGVSSFKQPPTEPNIDFELDVKVFFNSGKCVLHTKDFTREEDFLKRSMRKERSFSGGGFDLSSPSHAKKRYGSGMRNNMSASRLRYVQSAPTNQVADFTIFLIPGLDVKVHYNSKTVSGDSPITSASGPMKYYSDLDSGAFEDSNTYRASFLAVDPSQIPGSTLRKVGIKKACLFAWVTLQSIPEEAVVSPHLLDFLEQALEPIPIQLTKTAPIIESNKMEDEGASLVTPSQYAYASFPVDVIVYFRMQPSILRFSCLPISRVECILRLPSVDLVFSSKRAEDDLYAAAAQDSNVTMKSKAYLKDNNRPILETTAVSQTAVGGLSMTGCLADFSLYIFHPYGGAKKAGSTKEGETSPLSTSERKDSLSLQVEFVKVNISRSRKINLSHIDQGTNLLRLGRSFDSGGALIRFSAICDIGSASFKYDMRRLTEILAFPKAWYRRSIARRMFLGDQSTGALYSDQEDSVETSSSSGTMSPSISKAEYVAFSTPVTVQSTSSSTAIISENIPVLPTAAKSSSAPCQSIKHVLTSESFKDSNKPSKPLLSSHGHRDRLWLNLDRSLHESKKCVDIRSPSKSGSSSYDESKDSMSSENSSPLHSSRHSSAWETLVLFAVNLSRLNVHMNMGNVMGNTTWLTRDFKSQGRLSIGSNGHKNLFLSVGLEGSTLDSKGGIVGGTIELSRIDTCMHLKEEWGQEPDHTVALKLGALESRLDYMGTSVLMGRVSSLDITLKDEWRVSTALSQDHIASHPTKRPALIFVNGELSWDQLQLLISKSTTPDLIKMYSKLEEFFAQQFHSSKRVFSSLQPRLQRHSIKNRSRKPKTPEENEAKHHRHWQKVLCMVSGLQLSTMASALPDLGTILGGTMDLHGYNISLACFHGINFRSKAWAIFSMRKPTISFATEAQDIVKDDGSIATHIVQNLSYALGQSSTETAQHASMATVCRISRNVLFPPQFRSMHEWFHYAFATSELDDVGRFPVLDHDRESSSDRRVSVPTKGPEFNHNMEVIFALPSMQLHLKTEHLQPARPVPVGGPKPTIDCSFVTEFDDHIFVAVDAEAFFFLHDLITSYIKEKEVVSTFGKSHSPDSDRKLKMTDPTESFQKDWRNYQCHTWHLEPTVRLLSWAGKGIEPYGVDYILQKLGFAHARVTIPKWMQRGCMDPLDKILAVVMEKMIFAVRDDKDDSGVNAKK